jgi:hypothetical protein
MAFNGRRQLSEFENTIKILRTGRLNQPGGKLCMQMTLESENLEKGLIVENRKISVIIYNCKKARVNKNVVKGLKIENRKKKAF